MSDIPQLIKNDPWLEPYTGIISQRAALANKKELELTRDQENLTDFATGHLYFGLHKETDRWVFREWAPNATKIYLIGDFNNWKEDEGFSFTKLPHGNWEISLSHASLNHLDLYKLMVYWEGGKGERIPAYANRVVQDKKTNIFNAQVWQPDEIYNWKINNFSRKNEAPIIYEAHVGMATEEQKTGTYNEFREKVLPRIIRGGYNTIQFMAIQEHPYYGSFGYHVSSFFAASSRFGTPDELKALIDASHEAGIAVIMDIVHSHSVKNVVEGLALFDGSPYQYFHDGYRRDHVAWDSLCFNYGKNEVLHFLLSNCQYWLKEYQFDGFRFDGVTSMLYLDHGLSRAFNHYNYYYDGHQDEDAIVYLMLANKLIHECTPTALTIAEEVSGMPGLATPIESGGYGFDYRLAMGTPDYWIKIIKELPDEKWNVNEMYHELASHRDDEKTIGYAESHDQALVGDKTIIFRLVDKEMYDAMSKSSQSIIIDRGMALHKIIRLATMGTAGGGYLTFMGNEFGHPEWIDFPREGNNWSYKYARRQWGLADNQDLKFHYLLDFEKDMIDLIKREKCLEQAFPYKLHGNEEDQVLAFERASLLFVFNFNPTRSFTDYGINVHPGKFNIVLNTDDKKYGGFGLVDQSLTYFSSHSGNYSTSLPHYLNLYIPSRSALVLKRIPPKKVYNFP